MFDRLLCVGLLVILLVLGGCTQEEQAPSIVDLGQVSDCDVAQQTCSVVRDELKLSLSLGPQVQPLQPFPVQLMIAGVTVKKQDVSIDFRMEGMDMGINRYRLQAADDRHWQATATLPVCGLKRMDWSARVEFVAEGKRYLLRFPFQVVTNRSEGI